MECSVKYGRSCQNDEIEISKILIFPYLIKEREREREGKKKGKEKKRRKAMICKYRSEHILKN